MEEIILLAEELRVLGFSVRVRPRFVSWADGIVWAMASIYTDERKNNAIKRLKNEILVRRSELGIPSDKKYIYHGSEALINDLFMCSETYFTTSIEIAMSYGGFVYRTELNQKILDCLQLDCFKEHYISTCLLPLCIFDIVQ